MPLNPTLVKTLRKLLRFGASARAERIIHKLTTDELIGILTTLPLPERTQTLDILLDTPESGQKIRLMPPSFPALEQGLAALPDARLASCFTAQPSEVSAAVLRHLPTKRRVELRCCLEPELAKSIESHLRGPDERRERREIQRERLRREGRLHRDQPESSARSIRSIRERISALISLVF